MAKFLARNGPSGWYSHAWMSRADQSLSRQKPAMCSAASPIGIGAPSALPGPIQIAELELVVEPLRLGPKLGACASAGALRWPFGATHRRAGGADRGGAAVIADRHVFVVRQQRVVGPEQLARHWSRDGCRRRSRCSRRCAPAGAACSCGAGCSIACEPRPLGAPSASSSDSRARSARRGPAPSGEERIERRPSAQRRRHARASPANRPARAAAARSRITSPIATPPRGAPPRRAARRRRTAGSGSGSPGGRWPRRPSSAACGIVGVVELRHGAASLRPVRVEVLLQLAAVVAVVLLQLRRPARRRPSRAAGSGSRT